MLKVIKAMYDNMQLNVAGSDEYFASQNGLLQGEISSPILFSLFISDIEESLSAQSIGVKVEDVIIKILMFADDKALVSSTVGGLQEGLDELDRYCQKWGLNLNISKTKIMIFRKGGRLSNKEKWTYRGEEIEVVPSFKYLGCIIGTSGSFSEATKDKVAAARRAMFPLRCLFETNKEIRPSMQVKLFDAMVAPILFFGCEVWGLRKSDIIERFYLEFWGAQWRSS